MSTTVHTPPDSGRHHVTDRTPTRHRVQVPEWASCGTRLHRNHVDTTLLGRVAKLSGRPVRIDGGAR